MCYKYYEGTHVPETEKRDFLKKELKDNNYFTGNWNNVGLKTYSIEQFYENIVESSNVQAETTKQFPQRVKSLFTSELKKKIQVFIIIFMVYILYQLSLFPRYCNNLEKQIDSYVSKLMGSNTLEDILISINVLRDGVWRKNNLGIFIRKEILDNKSGIYYLLGQAGEGKTVALKQLALLLIKERKRIIFNKKHIPRQIPVLISIAEVDNYDEIKFEEQLCKKMLEIYIGKKQDPLIDWLYITSQKVFLYFLVGWL